MISLFTALKGFLAQNSTDRTKTVSLEISDSATTATSTSLVASQTATRTISLPDFTTTLVGTDAAQTLTNKTIDGDDNTVQDLSLSSLKTVLADANKVIQRDGSGAVVSSSFTLPSGALVGTTDTQTLTNKTIDGDDNTIQDLSLSSLKTVLADANKFLVRNGSGDVISNTKAVPTGVVVGDTDSQTLTNKTIDGDNNTVQDLALSSLKTVLADANKFIARDGSGAVVSVAGPTGAIVGTTDTQTLSNKTLDNTNIITVKDTNLTIQDDADTTKQVKFQASSVTTATTRTLTVPNASTTIVGTDVSQTLTNKTIDASLNTLSNITETMIDSGAASSGEVLTADGAGNATWEPVTATSTTQEFTASGSFIVPGGVTEITVYICGGGGGGAGSSANSSSGRSGAGGAGAAPFTTRQKVTPADTLTVTIGTGGTGGTGSGNGYGTSTPGNGTNSSVTGTNVNIVAPGGNGATRNVSAGTTSAPGTTGIVVKAGSFFASGGNSGAANGSARLVSGAGQDSIVAAGGACGSGDLNRDGGGGGAGRLPAPAGSNGVSSGTPTTPSNATANSGSGGAGAGVNTASTSVGGSAAGSNGGSGYISISY